MTVPGTDKQEPITIRMYKCRLKPEDLKDTIDPDIKHCDSCMRPVFRATDVEGVIRSISLKQCTWLDKSLLDFDDLLGDIDISDNSSTK